MTPARFRWGLMLILLGLLILLVNLGVINYNFFIDLLTFFPFFLIAVGIEKIFTRSRLQFISYLTSVLLFAGGLYIAFTGSFGGVDTSFFERSSYRQDFDPSIKAITATVRLDDNDLVIRDVSKNDLVYGRFRKYAWKPKVEFERDGDKAVFSFDNRTRDLFGGIVHVDTEERGDWYLSFAENVPLELECYGDGSDIHLNLSTTPLKNLYLGVEDAEIYLKLGDLEPFVKVRLDGYDSNLRLRVPYDAGLKIVGHDYNELLDELGLVEQDGFYVNEQSDSLKNKIEIDLDDNLSSVSIDFY